MTLYRALLRCYPAAFRHEYGEEMLSAFTEQLGEARRAGSAAGPARLWIGAGVDALTIAPKEHLHIMKQDIGYALRNLAAAPLFTLVAVLSLALGIGANTAAFSLLSGVLMTTLPVPEPEQLVMLTNPASSGVSVGMQDGERSLLTYAEFEQLRNQSDAFTGLGASQSALDRWQLRIQNGEPEEARGRLVSGSYFDTLRVGPHAGRLFGAEHDAAGAAPYIVISHDYWQRRFGGRADVVGTAVTIRKTALTVLGVAAAGFLGETAGQRPDFWAPLAMQAALLPGRDWLHDSGTDKVMWLHVFGRLRPGVSLEQGTIQANIVFRNGLEAYYGASLSPEAKRKFLDQRIKLTPGGSGASIVRTRFADPLYVLLAVVGVVLVIACANLANLLLARGAARSKEIALRLALGASRGRLVRQLLTESFVLAALGGVAGLGVAYFLHAALVRLVTDAESTFAMKFDLNWRVLAFSFLLSTAAGILFGLLPALRVTRSDVNNALKDQGRASTASAGQMRWSRLLVAGQIGLSLPLLVGAGMLLQTFHNLSRIDLGYARDKLVVMRLDAQSAGYAPDRRADVFRSVLDEIRRTAGVQAATFSENGLFSGTDSGDQISVEGYTPKGRRDRGSAWDQVGPDYFSVLRVPLLQGRDIGESDRAGGLPVCVINEAFAKLFFENRNPIGMHITTEYGDSRKRHQIVGVARDTRTHRIRGEVNPRYFVPITQPLAESGSVVYEVRTAGETGPVLEALRRAVDRVDTNLNILSVRGFEENISGRLAQDRIMAKLAVVLGAIAMLLAAIGLYGVLSHGVAHRRGELGIRAALGASAGQVIRMILRETSALVALGLAAGLALAAGAARLLASQLYGVTPFDATTYAAAGAVLVAVALLAAWLPARRAARVDPMVALRQE